MSDSATLILQLYTGREATPVQGARVTVTDPDTGANAASASNSSGRTQPFRLCTPPREESLDPDFPGVPYRTYDARIEAEGFTTVTVKGIQMFAGEDSILPLEMAPKPAGRDRDEEREYDIGPNALLTTR